MKISRHFSNSSISNFLVLITISNKPSRVPEKFTCCFSFCGFSILFYHRRGLSRNVKMTIQGILLILLITTTLGLSSASALDRNGDGMSDLWQELYDITAADAELDPDRDGFTNREEAEAGTDPHDSSSFLKGSLGVNVDSEPVLEFSWEPFIEGKGYQIQTSGDLTKWFDEGSVEFQAPIIFALPNEQRLFFRVKVGYSLDPDSDGDELLDWEESVFTMTNPLLADSDKDFLPDTWEWEAGWNPLSSDQDENKVFDDQDDFDGNGDSNLVDYLAATEDTDRRPTCTAIILDVSGSMRDNIVRTRAVAALRAVAGGVVGG